MKYTTGPFAVDEVEFIQSASTRVLVAVSKGRLNLNLLAREELANRGLNQAGVWVGPIRAEAELRESQEALRKFQMLDSAVDPAASMAVMVLSTLRCC